MAATIYPTAIILSRKSARETTSKVDVVLGCVSWMLAAHDNGPMSRATCQHYCVLIAEAIKPSHAVHHTRDQHRA